MMMKYMKRHVAKKRYIWIITYKGKLYRRNYFYTFREGNNIVNCERTILKFDRKFISQSIHDQKTYINTFINNKNKLLIHNKRKSSITVMWAQRITKIDAMYHQQFWNNGLVINIMVGNGQVKVVVTGWYITYKTYRINYSRKIYDTVFMLWHTFYKINGFFWHYIA